MVKNNSVPVDYYTTVSNWYNQMRLSQRSAVIQIFGNNIQTAILQGNQIVATSKAGVAFIYSIRNNYAALIKTF